VVSRPQEERELVARAKRGDVNAYEELVRAHQSIAFRVALVVGLGAADAEDVTQEAFVKAYRALGRFRPESPFRPWLLQIVTNEARNRRRSGARRAALVDRAAAEPTSGDAAPSPEAVLLASERRRALLEALEHLPDADREVLSCRYLLDLSEDETASALGIRRGTVKSRTSRALERLRAWMGEEAP
jgi:RNA polymerase sigma-70 factor (ECF subfamily)